MIGRRSITRQQRRQLHALDRDHDAVKQLGATTPRPGRGPALQRVVHRDAAQVAAQAIRRVGLEGQEDEAKAAIARWDDDHPGQQAVTTIESGEWYPAEDYHQEYWEGEGQRNPYCLAVIPPKLMKLRKSFQKYLKEEA